MAKGKEQETALLPASFSFLASPAAGEAGGGRRDSWPSGSAWSCLHWAEERERNCREDSRLRVFLSLHLPIPTQLEPVLIPGVQSVLKQTAPEAGARVCPLITGLARGWEKAPEEWERCSQAQTLPGAQTRDRGAWEERKVDEGTWGGTLRAPACPPAMR